MTGKDFLSELQKAIEYNSKSFVKITIDAPNSCTESIFPAPSALGVDRGTDIKIFFDKPMSEQSIYFTEDEIEEIIGESIDKQGYLLIQDTFGNIDIRKLW